MTYRDLEANIMAAVVSAAREIGFACTCKAVHVRISAVHSELEVVFDGVTVLLDSDVSEPTARGLAAAAVLRAQECIKALPDYQQRVIAEKADLDARREKLAEYICTNNHFYQLPADERVRMYRQNAVMAELGAILGQRIAAFTTTERQPA